MEFDEKRLKINLLEKWKTFGKQSLLHADKFKHDIIKNLSNNNKIFGYGASARSSTLLNYCEIDSKHISVVIDKNPLKHGLLTAGSNIPIVGLIATIIALIAITSSTIWQKKISNNLPLSVSNMYQALGGFIFHFLIIVFFAKPYIDFSQTFIIAMSHQIFLVSFGAFTILMFLIKKNSASKTVSIFFLIPATSAFMAWLFLNESLTNLDLIGFLVTTIGVYIATRD